MTHSCRDVRWVDIDARCSCERIDTEGAEEVYEEAAEDAEESGCLGCPRWSFDAILLIMQVECVNVLRALRVKRWKVVGGGEEQRGLLRER